MNAGGELARSVLEVAQYWRFDRFYYDRAEQSDWVAGFWDESTPFRRLFSQLDLTMAIELACGHGRHAAQIADRVGGLVLMDVNDTNVAHCLQRFAGYDRIAAVQNSGADFRPLPDGFATAIYCYDAMVHFEMDVVASYLRDTARVLRSGGRALYHHSNYDRAPGSNHREAPGARNFMSQALFVHLSVRAGLRVLESTIMDWDAPATDALTLLEKP